MADLRRLYVLKYGICGEIRYEYTLQSCLKYDPSAHSRSEKTYIILLSAVCLCWTGTRLARTS